MMTQTQASVRRPEDHVFADAAEHAVMRRVAGPDPVRTVTAAVVRATRDAPHSCWIDDAPFTSGTAAADRLAERELRRPLPPGDSHRIVVIRYRDDTADLVVVARRGALDQNRLGAFADALATGGDGAPILAGEPSEAAGWPPAPAPSWGLAGTDAVDHDAPAEREATPPGTAPAVDPMLTIAAVAVVLSRYEGSGTVRLAVVDGTSESGRCGPRVVEIPVSDERPILGYLHDVRAALGTGGSTPQDCPVACVVIDGSVAGERYLPMRTGAFPVTLTWRGTADAVLPMDAVADDRRVHPRLARRIFEQVLHVTGQLSAGTAATVGGLALIPAAEAAELADAARSAAVRPTPTGSVHERVTRIVAGAPHAPAVSDGTRRLTYRELDSQADAWARVLTTRGAGPGRFVGVCLKRNVDLVVALLAVLKTGAAYLPLDVQYPEAQLRYVADDADVSLVISTRSGFPARPDVAVLSPAELNRLAEAVPSGSPPMPARPADPAYVIYTSGTTGRPKGVVVPHANVLALIDATADDMELRGDDVWTLFHSSAFDFSVWEIWGCLLTGGHLVVVPFMVTRSPEEFRAVLARERVTVLSQTPTAFAGLLAVDADAGEPPLDLRLVVLGGETFNPGVLGNWFRRYPDDRCRLINMYGITETTVHVTAHPVRSWNLHTGVRCVGRAIPGWAVSVRDPRGRVLPPGVAGEIWVAGAGLAAGYLNRPELTAERFPVDPNTGERHYRSGDHGRLRLDGTIDHLGRLDDQVKLRGFRIELTEVRSVLLEDADVSDAVVVLEGAEDGAAHARLVGYVVLAPGTTTAEVKRRLAAVLPAHMTPAALIPLPSLPLTINGKLDRTGLRTLRSAEPEPAVTTTTEGATDPVTTMVEIFRSVVSAPIEPDDDFFELGGNSLLAVRLLGALRGAGFSGIDIRDLYRHRTVAALAAITSTSPAR